MGFIEERESRKQHQIRQELSRKAELEKQRQITAQEKQNRSLEEQRKKERLLGLQKESKLKFDESGMSSLLERLRKIGDISNFGAEDRSDGMYCCRVEISSRKTGTISRTTNYNTSYYSVYVTKLFRIITDSSGTITFQYGSSWPHKKTIEQPIWKDNLPMLEESLGRAYESPSHEREEHYVSPPEIRGYS